MYGFDHDYLILSITKIGKILPQQTKRTNDQRMLLYNETRLEVEASFCITTFSKFLKNFTC